MHSRVPIKGSIPCILVCFTLREVYFISIWAWIIIRALRIRFLIMEIFNIQANIFQLVEQHPIRMEIWVWFSLFIHLLLELVTRKVTALRQRPMSRREWLERYNYNTRSSLSRFPQNRYHKLVWKSTLKPI